MHLDGRLDAAVESDIVGYVTFTTQPGFKMVGCTFNGLDGQPATLNELLTGDFSDRDEIQTREGNVYTSFYYSSSDGGWIDEENYELVTTPFAPGTAFWLKTENSISVTLSGAVQFGDYEYKGGAGIHMLASTMPKELSLNGDITWTGLKDNDEIQIRNGNVYVSFYYSSSDGGWIDEDNYELVPETVKSLGVGSSFWLITKSDEFTMTIKE